MAAMRCSSSSLIASTRRPAVLPILPAPQRSVHVRATSSDAAAELERFASSVRQQLGSTETPKSVPVTMRTGMSMDSTDMDSKDVAILLLDKDTFYPYLEAAGSKLVVVDFFTDWCGPCKAIMPKLLALAQDRTDVSFVKFNCNKANKDIGQALAIKVAPTFHLYRGGEKLSQMTGADVNKLIALISEAQKATVVA